MLFSLRELFRSPIEGRGSSQTSPRRAVRARLHLVQLEDRLVPGAVSMASVYCPPNPCIPAIATVAAVQPAIATMASVFYPPNPSSRP